MSNQELATIPPSGGLSPATPVLPAELEQVLVSGDLKSLNANQRVDFYGAVCRSLGLNPLTKPFDYVNLNGKLTLYAKKDCTDQLRNIHGISVRVIDRTTQDGVLTVTVRAWNKAGREDEDCGSVTVQGLKGDALANAIMKAGTKAKRRVTLSICGLGMTDSTELETIPEAHPEYAEIDTGGHPVGTKAAAQYVAERKLAEMQEPTAEEGDPVKAPRKGKKDTASNFQMLDAFKVMKKEIGEAAYYGILKVHGFAKSNEITDTTTARTIYKVMGAHLSNMRATVEDEEPSDTAGLTEEQMQALTEEHDARMAEARQ